VLYLLFQPVRKDVIDDTVDVGRFLAKGTEPFYGGRIFRFYDNVKGVRWLTGFRRTPISNMASRAFENRSLSQSRVAS